MTPRAVRGGAAVAVLAPFLARLRTELEIPVEYPPGAQREAEEACADAESTTASAPTPPWLPQVPRVDLREVPFVTLDPIGSRDLDQAFFLRRLREPESGVVGSTGAAAYEVLYAIADVAAFVRPGGELDAETHRRALTVYGPDGRFGLHPPVLSEGAASLLPGVDRPAVVWRMRLDARGELLDSIEVRRSTIRSRAQLDYPSVQRDLDSGAADELLLLLAHIGQLRIDAQVARGGATLEVPDQEIETDDGGYRLVLRSGLACEEFNAQLSLLTGIAAARLQRRAGIGLWRTLDEARPEDLARLRLVAATLELDWPKDQPYGVFAASLDSAIPAHAAFATEATRLFRGAAYLAFGTERNPGVPAAARHSAIAAEYAHVTAPLRRLGDRYGTEIALAVAAGVEVPAWVADALDALPAAMAEGGRRASAYERESVDLIEAVLLSQLIGTELDGIVVDSTPVKEPNGARAPQATASGEHESSVPQAKATVLLRDPVVRARTVGDATLLPLGGAVRVRVVGADPARRSVTLIPVSADSP